MRRSREDTAETRRRIVETASRLFRQRGITPVGVADIMGALGLTVGGFYRHFPSKEALVGEAIAAASQEMVSNHARTQKGVAAEASAAAMLDSYLSKAHRDHAELGCPVASLCSVVAQESMPTREAFTTSMHRLFELVAHLVPGETKEARDRRMYTTAAMVGALVLSRATADEALADDLLRAVRNGLLAETPPAVPKPRAGGRAPPPKKPSAA
jgi:TetR/AcrR family transcriptional repressor of nem operon